MLKSLLIRLLGLISIVIGGAIFIWVIYNLFVERQQEFTDSGGDIGGIILPIAMVVIGIKWLLFSDNKKK